MEEKNYLRKIYNLVVIILIIVCVDFAIDFFSKINFNNKSNSSDVTSETTSEDSTYDVSKMANLNISQLVKLFDDTKNTYVVYLGRANCSACVSFLPTLQKMQDKYGYTTQYLDIRTVDTSKEDYSKLIKNLSTEVTLTVNGETKTDAFGSFYGYTPMVFIIKNGKFTNGFVGAYSESKFEAFLNDSGIK